MKDLRYALLSLVGVLVIAATASANTYYVSTTGNDGNSGSSAQPWRTIQKAVNTVSPGDTILVQSGTYAGCRIGRSGTAGAVCTLKADAGATVLINTPSPAARHSSLIEIENFDAVVSYWVIDGFELSGGGRSGVDLRFTDHVTVQNCYAHDSGLTGIFLAFCYYPVVQNNESAFNGEHGIYQSNSGDFPVIRGNNLHHNFAAGLHMNGARNFTPGDGIISSALVEKNVVWENGTGGGSGINCDGVSDSIIRNNLLYNNHASGISLYGIDGAEGSSRNKVYNNTIVMAAEARWCINIPASTEGQPNPVGNKIKNNILYNPHTFRGSITIYSQTVAGFESDYNIVVSRFSATDGNSNMSLAQWQALGFDEHSKLGTPDLLFVDTPAFNYHLKTGSPAIDAGTFLGEVNDDLEGLVRPQGAAYDAGCFESGQGGPGPAPAPVAEFTATPLTGTAPLDVQFTDQSTGSPTTWTWDFGDGSNSTLKNPAHTYLNSGSFTVALTAGNASGQNTKTKAAYISVTPPAARDYFCSSATIDTGKLVSGDHTDVHASDDLFLRTRAVKLEGKFSDVVTYLFDTGLGSASSLTITSESRSATIPQRQRIMLRDTASGSWDVMDDRNIATTADVTTVVTVAIPARYLSASGQVQLRIRTGDSTNVKWKHSIDLVKITAAP
jgi:parallel beta-helix repeat protein